MRCYWRSIDCNGHSSILWRSFISQLFAQMISGRLQVALQRAPSYKVTDRSRSDTCIPAAAVSCEFSQVSLRSAPAPTFCSH